MSGGGVVDGLKHAYRILRPSRVSLDRMSNRRVAKVTLCRGDKMNVMDDKFFTELHGVFEQITADEDVRVAVLTAEGKHFTAGLDLKAASQTFFQHVGAMEKAKLAGATAVGLPSAVSVTERGMPAMRNQDLHKMILRWQDAITALQRCRVPVIAAVHGKCIGGGVDLITAADVRMCSRDASFSIKEAEVGIVADLGTLQRVPSILSQGIVRELAFTGMDLKPPRAEALGFVNSVHEDREALVDAAMQLAEVIASRSPLAVQGTKEILNYPLDPVVAAGLKNVALHNAAFLKSDDLLQAVLAFASKRPAEFNDFVVPPAGRKGDSGGGGGDAAADGGGE